MVVPGLGLRSLQFPRHGVGPHGGLGLFMVAEGPSRGPFWWHGDEWTWVELMPGFTCCQWFLLHCQGMRAWTECKIGGPTDLDSCPQELRDPGT